ncbi:MAG: 5-formyltetrahydrofolate cyclo-ligase [Muribaculaceae bacterium]|nr:5-formyltetrahydrofolate cyclo-ligase [Muribaculaceae bacterium]
MDNILLKKQLRREMRERKATVTPQAKQAEADAVFAAIEHLEAFAQARTVLLYYSMPDELPTHRVVNRWAKCKQVYLPRVAGDDLELVCYDGRLDDNNPFHIAEPVGPAIDITPDLVIVPGVAFDQQCNRLGRGRGYYDRLLPSSAALTVGVALTCQIVDHVPCEPHDQPIDIVVTATDVYHSEVTRR